MTADRAFHGALGALSRALAELSAPSMIIGGVAVIASGVPRETIAIDATVLGRETDLDELLAVLASHAIQLRIPDGREFARRRQVLLLIHQPSAVNIEISLAWLPFEEDALRRARHLEVGGIPLRMATPEDLLIYKAAAWRDRDRSDIERLLILHLDDIDLARVRSLVGQIAEALDEPERMAAFDSIVARARGRG